MKNDTKVTQSIKYPDQQSRPHMNECRMQHNCNNINRNKNKIQNRHPHIKTYNHVRLALGVGGSGGSQEIPW